MRLDYLLEWFFALLDLIEFHEAQIFCYYPNLRLFSG